MKTVLLSALICLLCQLFTFYGFIQERQSSVARMQALGVCEVSLDHARRMMSKRQQWKLESYLKGGSK